MYSTYTLVLSFATLLLMNFQDKITIFFLFFSQILYDYSLSDDEEMMDDGKYAAGGGYGYRFEFQNCR